jgi:outer membrane protein assembly factor BamB
MKSLATVALTLISATYLTASDWPQFRGPNGSGVADEKNLPEKWSDTENVRWKAKVPGRSVASPVVAGGRVYVASASGVNSNRLHVVCFDARDGRELWHRELAATGNTGCHPKSSMAAPTPVANANGVYVLFATADLAAFDKDGNLKWYRSLTGDYPKIANQVGMASSPILWNDTLIVPMDSDGESFLAGVDSAYGTNLWKVERPKDINWVTPALRKVGDKTELLFNSRFGLTAYDPGTGKKIWNYATEGNTIPTPVMMGDSILVMTRALECLQVKNNKPAMLWSSPKLNSGSCSPVVFGDHIYNVSGAGVLVCCDKKGTEVWQERLKKGKYWASPIAADGKVFVFNDEGICTVVKAGGENATVLAANELKEEIMGTPAIADGAIFIQTVTGIYCIGKK